MGAVIMSVATLVMLVLYRIFADAKPSGRQTTRVTSGPVPAQDGSASRPPAVQATAQRAQREENLNPRSPPANNTLALVLGTSLNFGVVGLVAIVSSLFLNGADVLLPAAAALMIVGPAGYLTSLIAATRSHFGHRASARTAAFEEAWPTIREVEPYCLLLRPFGADGRLLTIRSPRSFWGNALGRLPVARPFVFYRLTIEQALQRSFQEQFGEEVVALVDQSERRAPPGPTFLRTSNEAWELTIRRLMMRASHVAIVVPPGFGVTSGLATELNMIKMLRMAHRTVVIGAPRVAEHDVDEESDAAVRHVAGELWGENREMASNLLYVTSDHLWTYFSNFDGPATSRAALFDKFYLEALQDSAHMLEDR